jgi:phage-related protein
MPWKIEYAYEDVEEFVLKLPIGISAKYFHLTELMIEFGPKLGMPHTRRMSAGLFELRVKGREGIARVFYCTKVGKRIVMLHGFVKKTQRTPIKELRKAERRFLEVKNET